MIACFKLKVLIVGLLLVSPAVGFWSYQSGRSSDLIGSTDAVVASETVLDSEPSLKIPVQVIRCGKTPEWVYVQISPQAVPEPGTLSLLGIGAILLMTRRQRP